MPFAIAGANSPTSSNSASISTMLSKPNLWLVTPVVSCSYCNFISINPKVCLSGEQACAGYFEGEDAKSVEIDNVEKVFEVTKVLRCADFESQFNMTVVLWIST